MFAELSDNKNSSYLMWLATLRKVRTNLLSSGGDIFIPELSLQA
jgi:hypothetical protein